MSRAGVAAIVLAAGTGRRMRAGTGKVHLHVGGKPILTWSLELFDSLPEVGEVVLVVAPDGFNRVLGSTFVKLRPPVAGGPTRHQSESNGLEALAGEIDSGDVDLVLVHDAARPFARPLLVRRVIAAAREHGAAIPCVTAGSNLVQITDDGTVAACADDLLAAQTPQAFQASLILEAHRRARREGFEGSDTASVLERTGHPVAVIDGSYDNIKITTADDLVWAEQIARHLRRHPGAGPLLDSRTLSA